MKVTFEFLSKQEMSEDPYFMSQTPSCTNRVEAILLAKAPSHNPKPEIRTSPQLREDIDEVVARSEKDPKRFIRHPF